MLSLTLIKCKMKAKNNDYAAFAPLGQQQLCSEAIDLVRFPLAVMVVFIHSFPDSKWLDFTAIDYCSLNSFDTFNVFRRFFSNVFPSIAVPAFFLISGYLFFKKLEQWDWSVWKRKMRSRLKTLVIPYSLWVTLYILYRSGVYLTIGAIIINGRPCSLFTDWFWEYGGFHLYWDSSVWGNDRLNWLGGVAPHMTAPHLVPLWFLRDLMVVVALTPFIYWLIKKSGIVLISILGITYLTGLWPDIHGLTATAAFYFSAGAYLSLKGHDLSLFYKYRSFLYVVCACLLIINMYFAVGPYTEYRRYFSGFYVITGVFSAINISYWLVREKGVRSKRLMVESCFFIYAFHVFILGDCRHYVEAVLSRCSSHLLPLSYVVYPWIDILICLLLYYLFRRFFPRTTRILTGGR